MRLLAAVLPVAFSTAALALVAGCATTPEADIPVCDLAVESVAPTEAAVGDQVRLVAGPLTTAWDTAVYVGGERALVAELDREGCEACDECRDDYRCGDCGDCDACDDLCRDTCEESVTIEVPEVGGGSQSVQLFNSHGATSLVALVVLGGVDTGDSGDTAGDSGDTAGDSGDTSDTSGGDTGTKDSGGK